MVFGKKVEMLVLAISCLTGSFASAKNLEKTLPFLGNKEIDITHYSVRAQIAQMPPMQIDFETDIDMTMLQAGSSVDLHVESSVLTVQEVSLAGAALSFKVNPGMGNAYGLSGSVLETQLPKEMAAGSKLRLKVKYFVKKMDWAADDMGIFHVSADKNYGQEILITRNWPYYGRFWLPSNDSPEDVAGVDYKISVPNGFKVAANGKLLRGDEENGSGLVKNGLRLFEWSQSTPTTVYNFAFAVGKFDIEKKTICYREDGEVNNKSVSCFFANRKIPSVVYYNKNHPEAKTLLEQIEKARSSTIYFSKFFGPYAFDKVGFVHSPYPFAMESTSMIVINAPSSAVHEIVHHWFGNNVHIEHWGEFWISEGFTTYLTGLFDEYLSGTNTACLKNPTEPLNYNENTDPNAIFTDTPYCKGAFALHNLRVRITSLAGAKPAGTAAFFDLMKQMYKSYSTKRLSTQEVLDFVRKNLVAVMKAKGVTVTQELVDTQALRWKNMWLTGVTRLSPLRTY